MKNKYKKLLLFMLMGSVGYLFANPQNPTVVSGDVKIDDSLNNILQIHASDQSIINWKDFSIDIGEITKFIQPDQTSAVLNRVLGEDASNILGKLQANGHVFLINPNGIIFGKDAEIDTAAFTVSTLNLLDEDFIKKSELLFEGLSKAAIINLGKINTSFGDVTLLGYKVENHGEINCPKGIAGLGVGRKILLKPSESEKIYICLQDTEEEEKEEKGLVNIGKIKAISAELKADGNPYSYAINLDGVVEANGFEEREGKVFILAEEGRAIVFGEIYAKNENGTGGEVRLLGKEVGLLETARVDVSAEKGEGIVLVGGDYKGQSPDIINAKVIYISPDSIIDASATKEGKGGKVILWGDEANKFHGKIFAHGGEKFGNGGFVETSSPGYLEVFGLVDTTSQNGNAGVWLLDPVTLTISNAANANIAPGELPVPPPVQSDPFSVGFGPAATANINIPALVNALGVNNIIIDSLGGGVGTGNILISNNLIWNSSFSLDIRAAFDLTVGSAVRVESQGSGDIICSSGNDIFLLSNSIVECSGSGNLSFTSTRDINNWARMGTQTGDITLLATNGTINIGNAAFSGIIQASSSGNINITVLNNSFNLRAPNTLLSSFIYTNTGNINLDVYNDIHLTGGTNTNNYNYIYSVNGNVNIGTTISPVNLNLFSGSGSNSGSRITGVNITANSYYLNMDATGSGASSSCNIQALGNLTMNANYITMRGGDSAGNNAGSILTCRGGNITADTINLYGGTSANNNSAWIGNFDNLLTVQANQMHIEATDLSSALISAGPGNLFVEVANDIDLLGDAHLYVTVNGRMDVLAGNNIILRSHTAGNPDIAGSSGGIYIVVDNNFPNEPDIGPGALIMDQGTQIWSAFGDPIYIFTATRDQNVINGLIQGMPFAAGQEYIDSATEMWGRYYPDSLGGGVPYTIFYKDFGLFDLAMEHGGAAMAELYRLLHGYGEYIDAYTQFSMRYAEKSKTNANTSDSFDFPCKNYFYLRKRTEPNEERITEEL